MHNREITHSEIRQFIKKTIGCKHQMFVLLPFERNLCQTKERRNVFMTPKCKS